MLATDSVSVGIDFDDGIGDILWVCSEPMSLIGRSVVRNLIALYKALGVMAARELL